LRRSNREPCDRDRDRPRKEALPWLNRKGARKHYAKVTRYCGWLRPCSCTVGGCNWQPKRSKGGPYDEILVSRSLCCSRSFSFRLLLLFQHYKEGGSSSPGTRARRAAHRLSRWNLRGQARPTRGPIIDSIWGRCGALTAGPNSTQRVPSGQHPLSPA
jgi:hypothetical protein